MISWNGRPCTASVRCVGFRRILAGLLSQSQYDLPGPLETNPRFWCRFSSRSPWCRALHPRLLDRRSCPFRREEGDEPFGCLGFLRAFYQSGGEHRDELNPGRHRADEIDAWNGKDFTYGRDHHVQGSHVEQRSCGLHESPFQSGVARAVSGFMRDSCRNRRLNSLRIGQGQCIMRKRPFDT